MVTNRTMINDLINDLDDFDLVLLRERIVQMMEITQKSMKENPEAWKNGIIAPSLYTKLFDKVNKHIGFNN